LVLPFLLWAGVSAKFVWVRAAALLGVAYGLCQVASTASRGAAVALLAGLLFTLLRGTTTQRFGSLAAAPLAALLIFVMVPKDALTRIRAFSSADNAVQAEAVESAQSRMYLMAKSITYTGEHPLFGVGPGQFSLFEGTHNQVIGTHGMWHETHNSFTQVSSECGIPALLFFVAGILSTFLLNNSVYREARRRPDCEDIRAAFFYTMLGMVVFCVAIAFLNFGYFFYLPALAGLSIAMAAAAREEMQSRASDAQLGARVLVPAIAR
jgi:O-antigen ligase